jgi:hypothetical protein
MSMFREYSAEALPVINELINICENVGGGAQLAKLLSMLEDARDEIVEEAAE